MAGPAKSSNTASSLPGLTHISFAEFSGGFEELASTSEFQSLQQVDSEGSIRARELQSLDPTLPVSPLIISVYPEEAYYVSSWLDQGGGNRLCDLTVFLEQNILELFEERVISRLASLPNLQKLDLYDEDYEEGTQSLPLHDQQLRQLTKLTALAVHNIKDLTPLQLPPNLLGLSIYGEPSVRWTDEEDVRRDLSQLTSLEIFGVAKNHLRHLQVLTNLRTLVLEFPQSHVRDIQQPLIKPLILLSSLALGFKWQEREVPAVVELLSGLPELRSLELRPGNKTKTECSVGVGALVEIVTGLTKLEKLELRCRIARDCWYGEGVQQVREGGGNVL